MGRRLVAPALSLRPPLSLYLLSLSLSLSQLVKERWSPTQAQKEVNTCLASDLESVPLAPDWVCCLLGALSGAKRERSLEQRGGIECLPQAPLISRCRHRPRGSG